MLTLLHQEPPRSASKLEVLLVLFPGFNTLDMNGPFDVLTKSGTSTSFKIQVASESTDHCGITRSGEGVKVQVRIHWGGRARGLRLIISQHDIRLDDALIASLDDYDVLVVPGGSLDAVSKQSSRLDSAFMRLIAAFSKLPPRSATQPRVLLYVDREAY
jgi:putative intracellular protease/amidase